jgi:hypothetical protein
MYKRVTIAVLISIIVLRFYNAIKKLVQLEIHDIVIYPYYNRLYFLVLLFPDVKISVYFYDVLYKGPFSLIMHKACKTLRTTMHFMDYQSC